MLDRSLFRKNILQAGNILSGILQDALFFFNYVHVPYIGISSEEPMISWKSPEISTLGGVMMKI